LIFSSARVGLPLVLGLLFGCGREVVQTAELDPTLASTQCKSPGALAFPNNAVFGTGTEAPSPLVGNTYVAGAGPGLYITARDAFRVYLNGDLVVASATPRAPVFVPLSLLPGDNALSVVVAAASGTPAALIELDDLDRSYFSDTSFRASTVPTSGFMSAGYDDSSWPAASDYGPVGSLPGCDPNGTFPADSTAHWIGPPTGSGSVAVLRKVIHLAPVGFGAQATGGAGAKPTVVTTWQELQSIASDPSAPALILLPENVYDFRDTPRAQLVCPSTCSDDPTKVEDTVLTSTQTCAMTLVSSTLDDRVLALGSNKTVVGLGRGALLRGVSFNLGSSQNIVLRNLAVYGVNPAVLQGDDGFTLAGANQVWIDHATTKWVSDGFLDATAGTQNITVSWAHFDGGSAQTCSGEHTRASDLSSTTATLHHSFFDHVETHAPKALGSGARVHLFNNLLSDISGYGVGSTCGAQVLMEGNTFQRVGTPTERDTCTDNTALGMINAPAGSNFYGDDVGPFHGGGSLEPHDAVFTPSYPYTVDVPQNTWLDVLSRAGAGGRWAQPLTLN
jgi:pectate lyase